jgi:hypothetical protein
LAAAETQQIARDARLAGSGWNRTGSRPTLKDEARRRPRYRRAAVWRSDTAPEGARPVSGRTGPPPQIRPNGCRPPCWIVLRFSGRWNAGGSNDTRSPPETRDPGGLRHALGVLEGCARRYYPSGCRASPASVVLSCPRPRSGDCAGHAARPSAPPLRSVRGATNAGRDAGLRRYCGVYPSAVVISSRRAHGLPCCRRPAGLPRNQRGALVLAVCGLDRGARRFPWYRRVRRSATWGDSKGPPQD